MKENIQAILKSRISESEKYHMVRTIMTGISEGSAIHIINDLAGFKLLKKSEDKNANQATR